MDRIRRVSIVGMGAPGILYGNFFAGTLGWEQVTLLADSDGVKNYGGHPVYCNDREWKSWVQGGAVPGSRGAAWLILSAVKTTALEAVIRTVRNQVRKDTITLSVLDGISNEEATGHALGRGHMLYYVAQGMDVVKLGSRLIYSHMGEIRIGISESRTEKEPLLKKVTDLFDETGLPHTRGADILHRLWCKWTLNMRMSQVAMVAEGTYGAVRKPGKEQYMVADAMAEVVALTEKENIQVIEEGLQSYVGLVDILNPEGMPSMRQDGLVHRRFEAEFLAGTVIRKAGKYGLDVPANRELYQRITRMEKTYQTSGIVYTTKGAGA